jgi:hypothetical protein
MQAQPGMQGQPGTTGGTELGTAPTEMASEKDLCDELKREARIHEEDIQGGAALVVRPRSTTDMSTLRMTVHKIIDKGSSVAGAPPATVETCKLFDVARAGGTTSTVSETADSIRILVTTPDTTQVKTVRTQMKNFAGTTSTSSKPAKPKTTPAPSSPSSPSNPSSPSTPPPSSPPPSSP